METFSKSFQENTDLPSGKRIRNGSDVLCTYDRDKRKVERNGMLQDNFILPVYLRFLQHKHKPNLLVKEAQQSYQLQQSQTKGQPCRASCSTSFGDL